MSAKPVGQGYNPNAYEIARKIAEESRNPTSDELTDLLRLMDFDSPMGEMKLEAHAIWSEMRTKNIRPKTDGYLALLNVGSPPP